MKVLEQVLEHLQAHGQFKMDWWLPVEKIRRAAAPCFVVRSVEQARNLLQNEIQRWRMVADGVDLSLFSGKQVQFTKASKISTMFARFAGRLTASLHQYPIRTRGWAVCILEMRLSARSFTGNPGRFGASFSRRPSEPGPAPSAADPAGIY